MIIDLQIKEPVLSVQRFWLSCNEAFCGCVDPIPQVNLPIVEFDSHFAGYSIVGDDDADGVLPTHWICFASRVHFREIDYPTFNRRINSSLKGP